jgi:hypothetical protein
MNSQTYTNEIELHVEEMEGSDCSGATQSQRDARR